MCVCVCACVCVCGEGGVGGEGACVARLCAPESPQRNGSVALNGSSNIS